MEGREEREGERERGEGRRVKWRGRRREGRVRYNSHRSETLHAQVQKAFRYYDNVETNMEEKPSTTIYCRKLYNCLVYHQIIP